MPDSTLSAALKEAYASATGIIYHTLELRHPAFTGPIRVVRGFEDIDARLEASAPVQAGQVVHFAAYPFDFTRPEITPDGIPQLQIRIDNVSREITAALEQALGTTDLVTVTYREYLDSGLGDGPENDPPIHTELLNCTANVFEVVATAGFSNLMNKRFPTEEYSVEKYPGLAT
ncbi:DUF1833 family protein [Desulfobulbus elongatus]|uniref:DUF1833 family protein n=1 Tax=Desulfobulbus elongatus TaxID=53332 RepID=UPI0004836E65|nr:DUF1833 family protein [Desulfobulbus elongatus]